MLSACIAVRVCLPVWCTDVCVCARHSVQVTYKHLQHEGSQNLLTVPQFKALYVAEEAIPMCVYSCTQAKGKVMRRASYGFHVASFRARPIPAF